MAITQIGYLILGLTAGAVVLFCWLGVECRRGHAPLPKASETIRGVSPEPPPN